MEYGETMDVLPFPPPYPPTPDIPPFCSANNFAEILRAKAAVFMQEKVVIGGCY